MNFLRKKQLQQRIRQDPYYRFQTLEEVATAAAMGIRIDANRATLDDWLRLPGISIHQGRALIQLTNQGLQFYSLEDVAATLGLSVQRLQPLEAVLSFAFYHPELEPCQIRVNYATQAELVECGLGAAVAQQIVAERSVSPFRNFADLQQRLQWPGELVGQWLHQFCFH